MVLTVSANGGNFAEQRKKWRNENGFAKLVLSINLPKKATNFLALMC